MKIRILILPFFLSLLLNALLFYKNDQLKNSIVTTKLNKKDSTELAICTHANDSLKKLVNDVLDFRHSSHKQQDSIITKHKKQRSKHFQTFN